MLSAESRRKKVEVVSKKARLVSLLKDAILSGELRPGEPIVETRVAQEVGVGQGVLREALIELEHQGFVQRTPYSGTRVTTLTHDDARDIFDIRMRLEPLAFAEAGKRTGPAEIEELRGLLAAAREAVNAANRAGFLESHLAYRRRVWELSGNKHLHRTLDKLVCPLFALYLVHGEMSGSLFSPDDVQVCLENQEETISALEQGDPARIERSVAWFLTFMRGRIGKMLTAETPS